MVCVSSAFGESSKELSDNFPSTSKTTASETETLSPFQVQKPDKIHVEREIVSQNILSYYQWQKSGFKNISLKKSSISLINLKITLLPHFKSE